MQSDIFDKSVKNVISALERNNIDAVFVERKEDVPQKVEEMLFDGCVITAGGSVSLAECGVKKLLESDRFNFVDRSKSGLSAEEKMQAYKTAIGCDFFLCSANALTENGELINVDGFGNRVSSLLFGPEKVILVVGINKIVKDVEEGFLRIKRVAAPKNCVRLCKDTPCAKLGHCVSLLKSDFPGITDGCDSPDRICAGYVITGRQMKKGRITVIICGEELGY